MLVSLTHFRQNLYALADQVALTGEPLLIERKGVRLKLVLADVPVQAAGRLARLQAQELTIGGPLGPSESPALWQPENPDDHMSRVRLATLQVAEPEQVAAANRSAKPSK